MNTKNKFYTARNDLAFKTIMLSKKDILKKIIESVLEEEIGEIKILNSELSIVNVKSKKRVVDILVQIQNQYLNVEMNNNKGEYINLRNATYLFNVVNESISKGEDYTELLKNEYIGISLSYENGGHKIRNEYKLQDEDGEGFIKNLKIIEINMEKLNKAWYTLSKKDQEKYKYLQMLDIEEKSLDSFTKGDKVMEEYADAIKKLNKDEEFRMHITEEEDAELIYRSDMHLARDEGIKQGAKQNAIETAKKMLDKNKPIEEIEEFTGLSQEEIEELQ